MMTKVLIGALERLGFEPLLVDRRFSQSINQVGRFSFRKAFQVPSLLYRTAKEIRNPDGVNFAVIFLSSSSIGFLVDFLACEVVAFAKIPAVMYLHTMGFTRLAEKGPVWRWAVARSLRRAAKVVVLGSTLALDVAVWCADEDIVIIPNTTTETYDGLPDSTFGETRTGRKKYALFLSNLIPSKGALDFVDFAKRVSEIDPDLEFRIIGGHPDPEHLLQVRNAVRNFGLDSKVIILGPQEGQDKWRWIAEAEVLVFPSVYPLEAQPLSIIEAMSVGTPTIAYDSGGIRDIIEVGINGYLVDSNDVEGMKNEYLVMLHSPREEIRDRTKRSFEARHSNKAYEKAWELILKDD